MDAGQPDARAVSAEGLLHQASRRARRLAWSGKFEVRRRQHRGLPDVVILGAQKAGTTSLHEYLVQEPGVQRPMTKECHYFDVNADRDPSWYRAFFGPPGKGLNIDSTPYYLFHPAVPERMHRMLPEARLVVLLREPSRRTYSHYWHMRKRGEEPLEFEAALDAEPARLAGLDAALAAGRLAVSPEHQRWSYLARSRYVEQLDRWLAVYPRQQMLVLRFEDLVADPTATLNETLAFLGLPPTQRSDGPGPARNARRYPPMPTETAERLRDVFEPYNRRLEALLGRSMGW